MTNITIQSRAWARRHKRRFDAVLTVEDPDQRHGLRFHRTPRPAHLVIACADLDYPAPEPYGSAILGLRPPRVEQVAEALAFAREHHTARLLVHCEVGISRSTGIALAILADRLGPGREAEALAELIRIRPEAVPNLAIVGYADGLLGRDGALLAAVRARDAALPWCQDRRRLGRAAHLRFYAVPREVWD